MLSLNEKKLRVNLLRQEHTQFSPERTPDYNVNLWQRLMTYHCSPVVTMCSTSHKVSKRLTKLRYSEQKSTNFKSVLFLTFLFMKRMMYISYISTVFIQTPVPMSSVYTCTETHVLKQSVWPAVSFSCLKLLKNSITLSLTHNLNQPEQSN